MSSNIASKITVELPNLEHPKTLTLVKSFHREILYDKMPNFIFWGVPSLEVYFHNHTKKSENYRIPYKVMYNIYLH